MGKSTNTWKLNNILLSNSQFKEKFSVEKRKYFYLQEKINISKNWDAPKQCLEGNL